MVLIKKAFLLVFLFLLSGISKSFPQSRQARIIEDDLKHKIEFTNVPQRVISLAPNLTEMIFALGEGKSLIANTTYCNYPPKAKTKIKVADLVSVDYEKILELAPDLILMTVEGNKKITYDKLKKFGFKIFVSNPRNFEGIKKTLKDLARIFDVEPRADSILEDWNRKVTEIQKRHGKKRKAMFLVSLNPLMLAGKNTFLNEYFRFCHLENIAADSPANYPVFSREQVLERAPEVILLPKENFHGIKSLLQIFPEWAEVPAVENGAVIPIDPDLFFRPGPRFVTALEQLSELLEEHFSARKE